MADNTIAAIIFYSFCALVCVLAIWAKSRQDDESSDKQKIRKSVRNHRVSH